MNEITQSFIGLATKSTHSHNHGHSHHHHHHHSEGGVKKDPDELVSPSKSKKLVIEEVEDDDDMVCGTEENTSKPVSFDLTRTKGSSSREDEENEFARFGNMLLYNQFGNAHVQYLGGPASSVPVLKSEEDIALLAETTHIKKEKDDAAVEGGITKSSSETELMMTAITTAEDAEDSAKYSLAEMTTRGQGLARGHVHVWRIVFDKQVSLLIMEKNKPAVKNERGESDGL